MCVCVSMCVCLYVCVLVSECLCTCDRLISAYLSTHFKMAHPEEFYEVTGRNIDARKEIIFFFHNSR